MSSSGPGLGDSGAENACERPVDEQVPGTRSSMGEGHSSDEETGTDESPTTPGEGQL